MPRDLESRMWRQLKGAFGVQKVIFVEDSHELLDEIEKLPSTTSLVFLEPTGSQSIDDIPEGDIALILGNTDLHNLRESDPFNRFHINTPNKTHLYGINAAAIALAHRYGQHRERR